MKQYDTFEEDNARHDGDAQEGDALIASPEKKSDASTRMCGGEHTKYGFLILIAVSCVLFMLNHQQSQPLQSPSIALVGASVKDEGGSILERDKLECCPYGHFPNFNTLTVDCCYFHKDTYEDQCDTNDAACRQRIRDKSGCYGDLGISETKKYSWPKCGGSWIFTPSDCCCVKSNGICYKYPSEMSNN
mmetsp:Transcript_48573/g.55056  ORF Transcript_48573/g.55056 Transcript_48573/m.55056 type:complete len:189 (+) Transcript_48573:157-723(+)